MRTIRELALAFAVAAVPVKTALAEDAPLPPSAAPQMVGVTLSSGQVLLWDEARGEYVLRRFSSPSSASPAPAAPGQAVVAPTVPPAQPAAPVVAPTLTPPPAALAGPPELPAPPGPAAPLPTPSAFSAIAAPPAYIPAPLAPAGPSAIAASPASIPAPAAAPPVFVPAPQVPFAVPTGAQPGIAVSPMPVAPAPTPGTAPPVPAAPPPSTASPVEATAPPPVTDFAFVPQSDPPSAAAAPVAPPSAPASPSEEAPMVLRRADLDERLGNFERLADELSIAEVPGAGYQLISLHPASYLAKLGLRAGDILLSVDGRPILGPDDAARAYAWLRVTDHFQLDLFRNGERVTLRYRVMG